MASAGHDPQWLQGFAAAIASVDRMHDRSSFVVDVMDGYGVSVADLKRAGVEDYDLDVIRKAMNGTTVRRKSSAAPVDLLTLPSSREPTDEDVAVVTGALRTIDTAYPGTLAKGPEFCACGHAKSWHSGAARKGRCNRGKNSKYGQSCHCERFKRATPASMAEAPIAPLAAYDSRMALVETMLNAPRGEPLSVSEILDELSIAAQYWAREVVKADSFDLDSRAIKALMIADTMSGEVRDNKSAKRLLVFLNALPEYPSTGSHGGPARRYKETLERTAQASRGQR